MTTALRSPVLRGWSEGVRPDPVLTVSEWADAHRLLPRKSSAEPGPWRTERTPYLREIMDCMSTYSPIEEAVFMKCAQVGGSECLLNAAGYVIDHAPGPMIIVQPTVELAKRFSKQRVEPLISDTPRLDGKVLPARSRDSGNTVLSKEFPSGVLVLTGANSAVGLRSMPAQYAYLDEIDGYPRDVDNEGSPEELVEARQRTFSRKKRMKVSTPTIAGRSAIEEAYHASDQRRYHVPCPDCGEFQPLEFKQLKWKEPDVPARQAYYECRACFHRIPHHTKTRLLASGMWVPENPAASGKIRGYHLNALYAPIGWMSWGDIAEKFVKVYRDPDKYRVFVNTVLGETWKETGEAPAWEGLYNRREQYTIGTVPWGPVFLTAGVDVQKDRLVVEIVGWARGKVSWSINAYEIAGDTSDLDKGPWSKLDELLERPFKHASGAEMPIRMLAVDSGYNTQTVYSWARKYPWNRVIAVKGQGHGGVLVGSPTAVEVTDRGKKLKRGARVWPVAVNIAKSELYGWLRLEQPVDVDDPSGYCHFPQYANEYFQQLTSEQLVAHKTRKGYVRLEWELIPGRVNHGLDARVYARCAAALAGLDRNRDADWSALEDVLGPRPQPVTAETITVEPPKPTLPSPTKPNWLGRSRSNWLKGRR